MSPLDIAELSIIEMSRWQREAMALPLAPKQSHVIAATLAKRGHIAAMLNTGRLVTAAEMAHSVGLSLRSVYRHIARLREAGMRIDGGRGVGYLVRNAAKPY